jgi:CrcB protein
VPRYDVRELTAVFAGGAVGGIARTALSNSLAPPAGHWPWVTFVINVVGAFMLGYFATLLQERLPLSAYKRPLLGTGLCGALTTFSTMQVELLRMLDRDEVGLALGYAAASVVCGFAAVWLATGLVRRARVVA